MNGKELYDADQKMAQNEALQTQSQPYDVSQPQSQLYIPPPQPQGYGTSQPQSQQYIPPSQPQSQQYIPPPQTQTYGASQPYQQPETPQPQPYQSSQPQTYQQSQPQSYQLPQTPYINPPVTNNMYQGGSNQSSNYVMSQNQNALLNNYKPFQETTPTSGRLASQMILAIIIILLSIIAIIDILNYKFRIPLIFLLMTLIQSILNLITGIWMIMLTIKKQATRNNLLGIISLISLIICILKVILYIFIGYLPRFDLSEIIILIIITSINMKCKCCD